MENYPDCCVEQVIVGAGCLDMMRWDVQPKPMATEPGQPPFDQWPTPVADSCGQCPFIDVHHWSLIIDRHTLPSPPIFMPPPQLWIEPKLVFNFHYPPSTGRFQVLSHFSSLLVPLISALTSGIRPPSSQCCEVTNQSYELWLSY